jgi:ABC-type multidrug transport system fused ATPase/permease subunit
MLAASYPLLDAFLTILWVFGFFLWIWLVIAVFADIIRSRDLSGWGKAAWTIVVIVLPLFGVVTYLIARGGKMHERQLRDSQDQEAAFRDYVKNVAGDGTTSPADELAKLAALRDRGVITNEEFEREKAKALSRQEVGSTN